MSIFSFRAKQPQAAKIAGVAPKDLQNWANREMLGSTDVREIKGGGVKGVPRSYSFFSIMKFAIAKELMALGLSAQDALNNADYFAHMGESDPMGNLPERPPSLPYHTDLGVTLFAISQQSQCTTVWEVGRKREDRSIEDCYSDIRSRLGSHSRSFIVIDATQVFIRVCSEIVQLSGDQSLAPGLVLDAYYKK